MPPWKKTGLPSQRVRADAEEGRAKLKTTAMTTKSTEGLGRGMGVRDWLPKKPQQTAPTEEGGDAEASKNDAESKGGRAAPTDLEIFFAKYGMKPPAWMEKIVLPEWLSKRLARRKRKKRKHKEEDKPQGPQPLPIPTSLSQMVWIKTKDFAASSTSGIRARYLYQKRLRQMEGPGPLEQAIIEYIFQPCTVFALEVREHSRAYFGVNAGFTTQKELLKELEAEQDPKKKNLNKNFKDKDKAKAEEQSNVKKKPELMPAIVTWHYLEDMQQRIQTVLALIAVMTILIGISIHELQFRGFIPGWEEDCANPSVTRENCFDNKSCFYFEDAAGQMALECNRVDTDWDLLNRLKIVNSVMTAWALYSLFVYYNYEANIISLRNHVDFSDPRLVRYSFLQVGILPWFCFELVLLLVHQIPFVTYDVIVNSTIFSGRPSVYSLDGIFALLMGVRVFQIFRWYRGYLFFKFRSRQFAKRLNEERMGTLFALRLLVLKSPLLASSHFLLGCVAVGSYWYRIAESSTNPTASVYYWDSLWFVADTLTGLPVADAVIEPKGQFGRAIAVVVRIMGIFWYVLLTNSFRNWAKFKPDELQAEQWLRLSTKTSVVKLSSIRLIQYLFLYGKNHWATLRQLRRFKKAKAKLAAFEEAGKQLEMYDFDVFLRAITVRRSEDVKLFEEKMLDLEEAYQELDVARIQSVEARRPSLIASLGAAASKAGGVVRSAKQAPQKLLYASKQAMKKVSGANFGGEVHAFDAQAVLPGQVLGANEEESMEEEQTEVGGAVQAAGGRFGLEEELRRDKAAIRKARKASQAIVTGQMNYEIILSAQEKEDLRQRTIGSQLSEALKELRQLRQSNNALMRQLGEEPQQVKPPANLEPHVKLEPWEAAMSKRLEEAEDRFIKLNRHMSECMGQLMVLIAGLYDKRKKKEGDAAAAGEATPAP